MSLLIEKSVDEGFLFELMKVDTGKLRPKFDLKDPRKNEELRVSILQKLCQKFDIDSVSVNFDNTFASLGSKFKNLYQRYQRNKGDGSKTKKFFDSIAASEPVKFSFVFKENHHVHSYYESQILSLRAQNTEQKEKISNLRQFQLENVKLKEENASLKAVKKNFSGRGPSKSHLLQYKPYSKSQIYKKKKFLCQKFDDMIKSSGLPQSEQLHSVTFFSNGNKLENFLADGKKVNSQFVHENSLNSQLTDILLFWKDKNLVSNAAFHELSMFLTEKAVPFPKFNKIQKRITELDSSIILSRTPGAFVGIQQTFSQSISNHVRNLLAMGKLSGINDLQIKLSSDGTRVGKRMHLITFGYHLASSDLICRAVKLLCVVKCPETYDALKISFSEIIAEIKSLSFICIDERVFPIHFFFGADLKMVNIAYGLNSCNCTYFCIFCYCRAEDRADFSKFWSMLDPKGHPRSIAKCIQHANLKAASSRTKVQNFNCSHAPMFPFVPISNVIPDTLHLFLRISDILFLKFLGSLKRLDNIGESVGTYDAAAMTNIARFEHFARNLNIEFNFFCDKESKKLCFTQLPAQQRLKIFESINLSDFLPNEKKIDSMKFLWSELIALYRMMNLELNENQIEEFSHRARRWAIVFSKEVYMAADVTPYIHILVYHMAEAMKIHGNLGLLSQQTFELLNHQVTQQYFRGSNHAHVEAFAQVFRKQSRMTRLQATCARVKRKYCKSSLYNRVKRLRLH